MPTNESVAARLLQYCRQWLTAVPHIPAAIISASERCIGERRLDQTVSSRAPYMEDVLDAFVTRIREAKIGRAHVELQSLMRSSYAVFCLKKNNNNTQYKKIKH